MKAMKKWTLSLAVILILCCLFTSCNASADKDYVGGNNASSQSPSLNGDYGYGDTKLPESSDTSNDESGEQLAQKIIRTVYMDAQTKEFDRAISSIRTALNTAGGFEESFSSNNRSYGSTGTYSRTATMTLRIPAEKLDAFLGEIGGLLHITSQRANVQNVTNEYYDIEARLNVLEGERTVYETMLQNAKTTSEMLSIRDRLYDVIEEIEAYETRLRVLQSQIAYSTVNMTLSEVVEYSKISEQDESFGDRIYDAFWTGWYGFVDNAQDFAVWFVRNVTTIGTLAIIGLVVLIIVTVNNKKHAPKPPSAPTEPKVDKKAEKKAAKRAKKAAKKATKAEKATAKKAKKADKKASKKAKKAEKAALKKAKKLEKKAHKTEKKASKKVKKAVKSTAPVAEPASAPDAPAEKPEQPSENNE